MRQVLRPGPKLLAQVHNKCNQVTGHKPCGLPMCAQYHARNDNKKDLWLLNPRKWYYSRRASYPAAALPSSTCPPSLRRKFRRNFQFLNPHPHSYISSGRQNTGVCALQAHEKAFEHAVFDRTDGGELDLGETPANCLTSAQCNTDFLTVNYAFI